MALWNPSNYSAGILKAWHDPSDTGQITTVSGLVSVDADKSGNGFSNSQSTAGVRPTYTTGAINSLNAETFNPATPNYFSTGVLDFSTMTQWALVWLVQITSSGAHKYFVSASVSTSEYEWRVNPSNNQEMVKGGIAVLGTSTSAVPTAVPAIVATSFVPSTGAYTFRNNGTSSGSGSIAPITFVSGTEWVGRTGVASGLYMDGILAERIYITSVTLSDIQLAEGYLAWKWGTVSSLDASHPYKSAAPTVSGGTSPFIFPRNRHYLRR